MELISVVVPFYMIDKEVIATCVNSIINQSYRRIEVFLIDDGNTNELSMYLDELVKPYPYISVIHQVNSGVSVARNVGIQAAKGDYIVFVDGDDCLSPYFIEAFVVAIRETRADIIYAEHVVFQNECSFKKLSKSKAYLLNDKTVVLRSVLSSDISKEKGLHGAPWGKAFKRLLLTENNLLFDASLPRSQDNEFNFRVIQYTDNIAYLPEEIYGYRESGQSAMTRYRKDSREIQERYLDRIIEDANRFSVFQLVEHDIYVITMIKFFDICNTCTLHPDNPKNFSHQTKEAKSILKSSRFSKALLSVSTSDFVGAHRLYVSLIKKHLFLLFCISLYARRLIKGLK